MMIAFAPGPLVLPSALGDVVSGLPFEEPSCPATQQEQQSVDTEFVGLQSSTYSTQAHRWSMPAAL